MACRGGAWHRQAKRGDIAKVSVVVRAFALWVETASAQEVGSLVLSLFLSNYC